MGKLTRAEKAELRKPIYELINMLLELDASGWPMDDHLKACGDALCFDDRPQYRPEDLSDIDYFFYLEIAKKNGIPVRVYKDRLRRNKPAAEAATKPYFKKDEQPEKEYMDIAAELGISANTYHYRRRRGWTKEKAAYTPLQRIPERD